MSRPPRRLPSLDLVRSFVLVGRRMSITLAAEDLCLSQSAVSRQILALEDALGVRLLHRGYRSIRFTAEGEHLFRAGDLAIQQLQEAMSALVAIKEKRPVTIATTIGVAGLWLLPRLGKFQEIFPDVDVRVAASERVIDLRPEGADLAIRYCRAAAAPHGAHFLFGERIVPVAHHSLGLERVDAGTITANTLIEFDDPKRPSLQWATYLNMRNLGACQPKAFLRFNQYDQAIMAALAGQGLALGRLALIEPLVTEKRLAVLKAAGAEYANDYAYWLIEAERKPRADAARVSEWIKAEAAAVDMALADIC